MHTEFVAMIYVYPQPRWGHGVKYEHETIFYNKIIMSQDTKQITPFKAVIYDTTYGNRSMKKSEHTKWAAASSNHVRRNQTHAIYNITAQLPECVSADAGIGSLPRALG